MNSLQQKAFDAEKLAYWFLRLNGFFTITNFVVHPDEGHQQRTDVDILGCRFPYRKELLTKPMEDYDIFQSIDNKILIVLAEVKSGRCNLNGPWTLPIKKNMQRVLFSVGCFQTTNIEEIASHMYDQGFYKNDTYIIEHICFGSEKNYDLLTRYENVPQITWDMVLEFIHNRFEKYRQQKSGHPQWDEYGKMLWEKSLNCDQLTFTNRILYIS
jgi:hypothetical protein